MAIWQEHTFGKLNEDGSIEYFKPYMGGLKVTGYSRGKKRTAVILNPTEADMNNAGWYRVVNVAEEGTDAIVDNILYHYTGAPSEDETEDGETTEE